MAGFQAADDDLQALGQLVAKRLGAPGGHELEEEDWPRAAEQDRADWRQQQAVADDDDQDRAPTAAAITAISHFLGS
uniref:Uncharacterized protein n=1 Tax=Phenylobacterium glaciei TaxID=2803784 RepID=A0A974P243_9CAUL|nr:hypothetical protein JKL49_17455 [Phenylobacterium glaciei]